LRFRIARKDLAERALQTHEHAQAIYRTLKQEFGLSTAQFNQIAADRETYTDERLEQAIERTRFSLKLGKITKSPAGFFMKALKEGWIVSDAEREMIQVQQSFALTEQRETEARVKAKAIVDLQAATHETNAQARMREEARVGRNLYDGADRKQKEDWLRSYLSSPGGKIFLRRLRMDPSTVDEAAVFGDADLVGDFSRFVFNRSKSKGAKAA
jgi:translation elongation factor EF-1beta